MTIIIRNYKNIEEEGIFGYSSKVKLFIKMVYDNSLYIVCIWFFIPFLKEKLLF